MGLNEQPSAERLHIAFFGKRNAGKSSLVNAITGQELAVVSDVAGTTTDPVKKAMELLPIGPVVIIDTPGIDDGGKLGDLRVKKTKQVLNSADIAVLVVDCEKGVSETDSELLRLFREKELPFVVAYNKSDLLDDSLPDLKANEIFVSAKENKNINEIKEMLAHLIKDNKNNKKLVSDLIDEGDTVVLVVPIDESAPKGRLILPQQQTIRDILEAGATAVVCKDTELKGTLSSLSKAPKLVITDSQAFGRVSQQVPESILLTSFSILFARYKGELKELVKGAEALKNLKDGDKVLISEGCTHHRQCGDIGSVKIPKWIEEYTGAKPAFSFTSGGEFPENLSEFSLVVHCGGCMLTPREMHRRMGVCADNAVPIVNYGVAIAQMHGILERSLEVFADILK